MREPVTYIGIAGMKPSDIKDIALFYENLSKNWRSDKKIPLLFFGLQTSRKFLHGESINPLYFSRMVTTEEIKQSCTAILGHSLSRIIVHYNPSGGYNLLGTQAQVSSLTSLDIDGIQWNGFAADGTSKNTPPFPVSLEGYITYFDFISILQVGEHDFSQPKTFSERMKAFSLEKHYTHFLLDGSGGRGIPINEDKAILWLREMRETMPSIGLSISGGLGSENLSILTKIKETFGNTLTVSIDAEGTLREDNTFSVPKAKAFIAKALSFYE